MARPIVLETPPQDARTELSARIEKAPAEHAEAILAAYDVLQALHDRGVLDLLRGALGASDHILETVVGRASTPQAIHGMRNLVFWRRTLGSIHPEWFQAIFQAIPEGMAIATARKDKPVSLWGLLRQIVKRDTLRGAAAAVDILETFGRHLATPQNPRPQG